MTEPGYNWRRASRGLLLAGFGTFLLLTTLDVLSWSFWLEVITLWPVLLIALGIRLIFQRSQYPWAVLLSPLLILGAMAYVASAEPRPYSGPEGRIEAARPLEATRWRLEGDLALADLDLHAGAVTPGLLLEGEVTGERGRPSVTVLGSDDSPRVRMRNLRVRRIMPFRGRWGGELRARLAADLPVTLDLDAAFVEGVIDLGAAVVARADVEGAFLDLSLRLPAPAEEVTVRLEGAFNRLELEVPAGTPVEVRTDGFMNHVGRRRSQPGGGAPGYRLLVAGAGNWVNVQSD